MDVARYLGPDYPRKFVLLKDGREVLIRPIGLADAELEREFLKSLSPQTSNNRFMG